MHVKSFETIQLLLERSMIGYFKATSGGKLGLSLLPTVLSPALIIGNPKCQKRPSTDSSWYLRFWLDVDDELPSLVCSNEVVVIEQGIDPLRKSL